MAEQTTGWQPIETAPRDDEEILVAVCVATVWIVRNAAWADGSLWDMQGFANQAEAAGWWFYENSVSQSKMDGFLEPTHWMPRERFPDGQ